MIVEWFMGFVAKEAFGFLAKNILTTEFAQDLVKDYTKDFFKDRFNNVASFFQKEPIQKAIAKALKEFLQIIEEELKFCNIPDENIKKFAKPLKQFIYHKSVKQILGQAFDSECNKLDYQTLEKIWQQLNLPKLPAEFNWQQVTNNYLRKCRQILSDSSELKEILILQKLTEIQKEQQKNSIIQPDFNLNRYQEAIRECYSNLQLESLDTNGYIHKGLGLWQIFIPQNVREVDQFVPKVYELPKAYKMQLQEGDKTEDELEIYKQIYFERPISSVKDVVQDQQNCKYIVILGDPGSGKSTLLKYLALDWVEQTLDQLDKPNFKLPPIPLLIELRTYIRNCNSGKCKNFLDFFHHSSGAICHLNQNQLQEYLKAGNALVMFDGLDEVFEIGQREDIITEIHRFTNEYPNLQVIVTSRVIGYKAQRLSDAGFSHFLLQDLESTQIQDFMTKWHDLTFSDQEDKLRKKERLQRAIETSPAIAELAGNPLLLTMMAILNRSQELPRYRAELYQKSSEVLLYKWDVERAVEEDKTLAVIDYKDKQVMLRQVAYKMQTSTKDEAGNVINDNDLEKIFTNYFKSIEVNEPRDKAKRLINQLRTRNFMLCFLGADYYAFVHRTFLEFFCAGEFVHKFGQRGTDNGLTLEQIKTEVFGKYWHDESWHEVLRLIAGMIDAKFVEQIIEYLINDINGEAEKFINIFLAAKCLAEVRNIKVIKSTDNKLLNRLKDLIKYDLPYYYERYEDGYFLVQNIRTQAVETVATIWQENPDTLEWLKDRATADSDSDVRHAAVLAIGRNYKQDPDILQWLKDLATLDSDSWVRRAAVETIGSNYKQESDTLEWLKDRATVDSDSSVRRTAVYAIGSNYKQDPDILAWLKDRATVDSDSSVRHTAVSAIGSNYKQDPDILAWLKDRTTADNDLSGRYAAVSAIVSNYKQDPDILAWLKDRATADSDLSVRRTAVSAIGSNYKQDPDILAWLKDRATADSDLSVRHVAVFVIGYNYKQDPDILEWLKDRATADSDSDVQRAAVSIIGDNYKQDPDILEWLKDRATADSDSDVRCAAVYAIVRNYKQDPDILAWLKDLATADSDSSVRYAAVFVIGYNYKQDPDILEWLKNLATADSDSSVRYAAVSAIGKNYKANAHPELFDWFYNCAQNDPFERKEEREDNPRLMALKIISKVYLQHPQTVPLLQDRAENDPDEKVRVFAQEKLAELEN